MGVIDECEVEGELGSRRRIGVCVDGVVFAEEREQIDELRRELAGERESREQCDDRVDECDGGWLGNGVDIEQLGDVSIWDEDGIDGVGELDGGEGSDWLGVRQWSERGADGGVISAIDVAARGELQGGHG